MALLETSSPAWLCGQVSFLLLSFFSTFFGKRAHVQSQERDGRDHLGISFSSRTYAVSQVMNNASHLRGFLNVLTFVNSALCSHLHDHTCPHM